MVGADLSELETDLARIPTLLAEVGSSAGSIGGDAFAGLDTSIKEVGDDAEETKGKVEDLGHGAHEAGEEAEEGESGFEGLKEGLIELATEAGIVIGVYEALKTAFESTTEIETATVALGLMTGSAEAATEMVEGLRATATEEGLDFPQLVTAAQRMVALGVSAQAVPGVLQGIADSAAQTGFAFDSVASSFDRLALSGQASNRQLVNLGLSLDDLATVMSTTKAQVADVFKALDESERVTVLQDAFEKFGGAAAAQADTLKGHWNTAKDELDSAFESIGIALEPIAVGLLGFLAALPSAAESAVSGLKDLGAALGALLGPLTQVIDIPAWLQAFGNAIGVIAAAIGGLVTNAQATVLLLTDVATLNWSQAKTDAKAYGESLIDLKNKIADIASQSAKVNTGSDTPVPPVFDKAAAQARLDALQDAKDRTKILEDAVTALNEADNQHATDLKALYIPSLTDVASAEREVGIERLGLQGTDQALVDAETALRTARDAGNTSTQQLKLLEDNVTLARATAKSAASDYSEAEKSLKESKAADAELTKDLQSAEDALAAAEKSTHIPAILDHQTALDNIATAQNNYELAVSGVKAAEAEAETVQSASTKTAEDVKTASDNLAAAKNNLKTAVANLKEATDDEKTSLQLVGAAQKELASDEEAAMASKKTLGSGIVDLNTSLGDYRDALQRAKEANDTLGDAETSLQALLDSGTASAKDLKEATDAAKTARQQATTADKDANTQLQTLTSQFGLSKDAVLLLNQAQSDGVTDTQTLQAAFRLLGEQSTESLNALATAADQAYKDILDSGTASSEQLRIAQINDLMAVSNAKQAQGQTLTTQDQLTLATLKQQQADYQSNTIQGWATMYSTIDADVKTTAASMIRTLFEGGGSFHDEAIKGLEEIGEAVVTKFTKPFTDAIASLISGAISSLLSGNGLKGISDALDTITSSLKSAVGGFKDFATQAAGIGASGTGAIGDTVGTGDTLAGVGGAGASSGASGSGLGLSSITGIAGIATAIASIGSGITAGLQAATTNDHLFHIMSDTAYIKAYTGYTAESTHNTDVDLQELMTFNWGTLHMDLINIGSGIIDGLIPRIDQANASLMRMFDLELLQTAFAAKTAGYGSLSVTLTNSDPKAVAQNIAQLLGLSAPSFA